MNLQQHRRTQDRAVTLASLAFSGVGLAGALSPAVEHAITTALVAVVVLVLLVVGARWVARRLREHREDRADALAAAVWRAEHLPHLTAPLDRHDAQHCGGHVRAGVA